MSGESQSTIEIESHGRVTGRIKFSDHSCSFSVTKAREGDVIFYGVDERGELLEESVETKEIKEFLMSNFDKEVLIEMLVEFVIHGED